MKKPLFITSTFVIGAALLLSLKCASSNNSKTAPDYTPSAAQKGSITRLLTEKQFNDLFPMRDKFYTYTAFTQAVNELGQVSVKITRRAVSVYQFIRTDKATGKSSTVRQDEDWNEDWAKKKPDSSYVIDYGNFCNEKDLQTNKRELAAFFANIAHETRHGENGQYNDGLMFIHENNTSLPYVTENDAYPAVPGKKYYGRGPLQLSYNGNYGYASDCIFGDKKILLENPEKVENDAVTAFKTAIYFWMTPQTAKPSAHDVMIGKWQPTAADKAANRLPGFGMTINIINGEVECNKGENIFSMNDRIGFYQHFLKAFGITDDNCACSCGKMRPFN
ncbi:chitinase [Mucilaginibacter sp. L3T2-6]|uniref:chitinase n=1 Tax=Mucilaginibacter sp. L3T2-6 TaxID=3062491 RepID=UPI002676EBE7|nr:chitinase [Mucilaginibacter sp. L3T2-6]MDO3642772.1 chitinase [Mucilaginibacter sp. L3T2-6]MDV6215421.1 chitinase [Mucilaginibacter sp. L3T2-6]